jgi:uncharacterized protein (TIGR02099 family)
LPEPEARVTGALRRRARRVRRVLAYGLVSLLILLALVVAIANQMLPVLARHPADVAQWLSERIGRPVSIDAVDARWSRRGPLLRVTGLRIGAAGDLLEIGRAELQVNAYAGFLPGVPLTVVKVRGPTLELTRGAAGEWRLEGLGDRRGGGESFDLRQLDGLGELQIEDASLSFLDVPSGRRWTVQQVAARLRTVGARFRLGVVAQLDDGAPLQLVAEMDRELSDGRVYFGGEGVRLAPLLGGSPLAGIEVLQADGDLGLWLDIADREAIAARLEARLEPVRLRGQLPVSLGPEPDAGAVDPRYGFERVHAQLSWRREAGGWHADIDHLDLDAGDARTRLAGVSMSRDEWLRLRARELEVGPLLALAMLSDAPSPALRRWLYLAAPRGQLADLELDWRDRGAFRVGGRMTDASWQAVGHVPGVENLGGRFDADAAAASFALQADPLRLTLPGVLRAPLTPAVDGRINAYALDAGWRIEAAGLAVRAPDYAFDIDGGLELQGDGTRPLLDLRAQVHRSQVPAAKQFWFLNKMPPRAIDWLDTALVAGTVEHGVAMVRGDADHWPFREHEGRFEAQAEIAGTDLRFRRDWPAGDAVGGTARFINDAMEFDLHGNLLGNRIERVTGGIATLKQPILELQASGGGSGAQLLGLLRASPLQERYGPYLTGLDIGGEGAVELGLHIPLKPELGEPRVEGHVDLKRADLHDAKWDLDFAAATGRVRFSNRGFLADELNVGFAGALGTLSVAVGDYTSDDDRIAEASLRGRFAADALLDPYAKLHWLKPWLEGESEWTLQLSVPRETSAAAPQLLRVRSDLQGTALSLPAPLRKDAADRLALDLALRLPLADGSLDLRLGQLLRLRGQLPADAPFRGVATFGDAPEEEIPAQGLVAVGQAPVLDAAGWAGFALASGGGGAGVQRVDLYAGELDVLDRAFPETRLQMTRDGEQGLRLEFDGPALQGRVDVPLAEIGTHGITARFARLHWPSQAPRGAPGASAVPSAVPPLHVHIEDFRFGEAALGETRLETYPTPEGMHVQQLDTTSKDLTLRASGDWTRIDGGERSAFKIDFTAADLGAMLGALGFSKLIEGGRTRATLQATWPGAPSAFELQRVDGTLTAKVGKGRVLEVDPGAGRLFGLLSLTEIPRRLALDFTDFFKSGLAFNEITGTFKLDGGNAFTDDLRIDGPAAEIRVRGRTGLKAKDYDQTMEVLPRAGSVLPALGALAAGPAGAAIGAVAQAVLQRPIKQMARTLYQVQGSWAEPKIEVIDRGPAGGSTRPSRR